MLKKVGYIATTLKSKKKLRSYFAAYRTEDMNQIWWLSMAKLAEDMKKWNAGAN